MSAFDGVKRIPATRLGSLITRVAFPSGQVRTGESVPRGQNRMRRHVLKGTTDDWVGGGADANVVVNRTTWTGSETEFFNLWSIDLTISIISGLFPPNYAGQMLIIGINKANGKTATFDVTISVPPNPQIRYQTVLYDTITLDADGDYVFLMGIKENDILRWEVTALHGAVLA